MSETLWKTLWSSRSRALPIRTFLIRRASVTLPMAGSVKAARHPPEDGRIAIGFRQGSPGVAWRILRPESSPFQLPTELADGLGLGSGLGEWLPTAVRPIPGKTRGVWVLRTRPWSGRVSAAQR